MAVEVPSGVERNTKRFRYPLVELPGFEVFGARGSFIVFVNDQSSPGQWPTET
jgi:hypothetical protein